MRNVVRVEWMMSCAVCYGSNNALSHPNHGFSGQLSLDEHNAKMTAQYESYKAMYSNCTVIDGNLEIVYLESRDNRVYDLDFLRDIREVIPLQVAKLSAICFLVTNRQLFGNSLIIFKHGVFQL